MAEERDFEKQIRDDAETFVARIAEVERIIEGLTPASTLDESTSLAVMERLDDLGLLRFLAWCLSRTPDWLPQFLLKRGIQKDKVERIAAFASKYSAYELFLSRLNRANQGYENEITRLSGRPSIQTFGDNIMVTLRFYNYDRLLLSSSNGLDTLVTLIGMLIQTANDAAESIVSTTPELLRRALDPEGVADVLKGAQTLSQLEERLRTETEAPK